MKRVGDDNEALTLKRAKRAEYMRQRRANATPEMRERERAQRREVRANATSEQRERIRLQQQQRRLNMTANALENQRRINVQNSRSYSQRVSNDRATHLANLAVSCTLDETTVELHYCGKMEQKCSACGALHYDHEKFNTKKVANSEGIEIRERTYTKCCQNGQVVLPAMNEYPEELRHLMQKEGALGKNFIENIRPINSSFAFASMGANIDPPPGYGPYCFRIHGQIYHRTGTLHPKDGDPRSYAQLYILDEPIANAQRASHAANKDIDSKIFELLDKFMKTHNPFAQAYKMLHEVEEESHREAVQRGSELPEIAMAIVVDRSKDARRYNAQVCNEVAVVFQSIDGLPPAERDLIIHCRVNENDPTKGMKRLKLIDPNLEPMSYPLFFPFGEQGWGINIERNGNGVRKSVTLKEYLCHRLASRENVFNPLINGGKLTQEYFVNAYTRMEAGRLDYIRNNQETFRGSSLNGLRDFIAGDNDAAQPGQAFVLPSSFPGGPRYMQQTYQDAMAIVTKYGKPDLFITMTSNPKWKEITENLEPWQSHEHRPDLVAQVFELKLNQLLEDIVKPQGGIFGKVLAYVWVIEFQKRGLPHAHILIICDSSSKPDTADKIDKIVNAEIPDKQLFPRLYDIVTSNMLHRPCGKYAKTKKYFPCIKGDTCQKKFPKPFQEKTLVGEDGYALYMRRKNEKIRLGDNEIDNSWIVPYNPYLLLKYNCHINVEVCASIKSVKYLYKYIFKGHDCASIQIKDKKNEIQTYVDTRYVSAPEAAHRIFGFNMHAQSHSVDRLPIHLPGDQFVVFKEPNMEAGAEEVHNQIERVIARADANHTMLTGYFELNRSSETARQLYYWQIPTQFTWVKQKRIWKVREKYFNKIGRMYALSPKAGDVFYLRLLLLHVKGATSFEFLLTANGINYSTFKDAAKGRGLLLDDDVWKATLDDAIACSMPSQLRNVFAYICIFCGPSNPKDLWMEYLPHFKEDFCHKVHNNVGECMRCDDYALRELRDILQTHGLSLEKLGLPDPAIYLPDLSTEIDVELEQHLATSMVESLNIEQKSAFDAIVAASEDQAMGNKCFFVDGPGGSGKTYLYTALTHFFKSKGGTVLSTATTGIAANLLIDGRTMHSMFKLQIANHEGTKSNVTENTILWKTLKNASLIILDECTMASCHQVNAIDKLLRNMTKNIGGEKYPFGGKLIMFGGDFRQCLSVIPHAARAAIVQGSLKSCNAWRDFKRYSLINNMRCIDLDYSSWLLKLGSGEIRNDDGLEEDFIEIPPKMLSNDVIKDIFGEHISLENVRNMSKMAILCPKNSDVDKINAEIVKLITTEEMVYLSYDSLTDEDRSCDYTTEFLNSLTLSGMPPNKLILKVGCVVMLLRNLNTKEGLCNGTRFVVTCLRANLIECEVLTGSACGNRIMIPRIDLTSDELGFTVKRRQFPVKVAFAMTINKSQGQTLDKVGLFLREPVFGHGQLYVALSRVKCSDDVRVQVISTHEQGKIVSGSDQVFTKNVVYREVLGTNM